MKKEDFYNTKWDVSKWTQEQKVLWQHKCHALGFSWRGRTEDAKVEYALHAESYYLYAINNDITYTTSADDFHYHSNTEKYYGDMFPEQPEEKLDIIAEIVKLVHESQGDEDVEGEDSFEGLVYVAPEEGQDWLKYYSLERKSCSEAQWNYVLANCPLVDGSCGRLEYLQICNDGDGWFDNDESNSGDIVVSFNDLFQHPKED